MTTPTMTVRRVPDGTGTSIDPPLDPTWSDLDQLRWRAAVVALDTGLAVGVLAESRGGYNLLVGRSSTSAYDFDGAWSYLNGVAVGASQQARRA